MLPDGAEGYVLAAADYGVWCGEVAEFGAQTEGLVNAAIEAEGAVAGAVERTGAFEIEAGDLAFEDRPVNAAGPGPVDMGNGRALLGIGDDLARVDGAAEEGGEFSIGDEAEAAGDVIAGNFAVALDCDRTDIGADGPSVGAVPERPSELGGLEELGGFAPELPCELGDAGEGGLFGDENDLGTTFAKIGSDGEQERARAGDDHAFASDGQSALDHGLQATGAEDMGERPAGEGKKTFAGAGGQDDSIGGGNLTCRMDLDAGANGDAGVEEAMVRLRDAAAPDLAAEGGIVVEERDLVARLDGGPGGGEAGGATADDEGTRHRSRPPCRGRRVSGNCVRGDGR